MIISRIGKVFDSAPSQKQIDEMLERIQERPLVYKKYSTIHMQSDYDEVLNKHCVYITMQINIFVFLLLAIWYMPLLYVDQIYVMGIKDSTLYMYEYIKTIIRMNWRDRWKLKNF